MRLLKGGLAEDDLKKIDREARDRVTAAADFALADPEPDAAALYTDVLVGG